MHLEGGREGRREEREVRIYVLPVGLPRTGCTSPPEASALSVGNIQTCTSKRKLLPWMKSHKFGCYPLHLALCPQLPATRSSYPFRTTDCYEPWGRPTRPPPRGFSTPCCTSVKSPFIKPFSNFSIQVCWLFPLGTLPATNSKQLSYFCHL